MAFDRSKFIKRFIDDVQDHLKAMNQALIALEGNASDTRLLDAVFRAAHTIKGSSRMMKLLHISDIAHLMEDVMDGLRKGSLNYSKELSDALFTGMDSLSDMVQALSGGQEKEKDKKIVKLLTRAAMGDINGFAESSESLSVGLPAHYDGEPGEKRAVPSELFSHAVSLSERGGDSKKGTIEEKHRGTIRIDVQKLDELINLMGEILSCYKQAESLDGELGELSLLSESVVRNLVISSGRSYAPGNGDETVLSVKLQELHNRIKSVTKNARDFISTSRPHISALLDCSLGMRMLPLSTMFEGFHMSMRELSRSLKRSVIFEITGGETEMDKKMMEKLEAPLLHMIRNSMDHGIEPPEERRGAGKPEQGTVKLVAGYEGSMVLITLSDDGRGISLDKIREQALKKGLVLPAALPDMTEKELLNLIFAPGFSTSEILTDVSGRGVGMDVVKQNIEIELNGSIDIETQAGKGTVFTLRLPGSIAVIHVFFVKAGVFTYAVPAPHISEIIRLPSHEYINVQGKQVIRLRENIIPVIPMTDLLGLSMPEQSEEKRTSGSPGTGRLMLITEFGNDGVLAIEIDAVLSEEERVVKPLPDHMKNIEYVSGGIIDDNNVVVSVLHIPSLVKAAETVFISRTARTVNAKEPVVDDLHLLVVDDSVSTREIEKSILESHGYSVTLATDGVEGLEKAGGFNYDLVISDVDMPRMDGFTMTKKLRMLDGYRYTPIVLVTSRDTDEDIKKGIDAGANAYILKGDFEKNNLFETIENLLG